MSGRKSTVNELEYNYVILPNKIFVELAKGSEHDVNDLVKELEHDKCVHICFCNTNEKDVIELSVEVCVISYRVDGRALSVVATSDYGQVEGLGCFQ